MLERSPELGRLRIGVDIGGTKTDAAIVHDDGNIGPRRTRPTPVTAGPSAVIGLVVELVDELCAHMMEPVRGVGVGSAGVFDPVTGTVLSATGTFPGWAGTPVRGLLEQQLGLPIAVDNDVNAHALGELTFGAGRGVRELLYVAVGTGIGAGLVCNGELFHGARGVAGEIGHLPVAGSSSRRCPCGRAGHLEAVAAGPAMAAAFGELCGTEAVTLHDVRAAADRGDERAVAVISEGATALGRAIAGLICTLDPELVIVGGGVTGLGVNWWDAVVLAARADLIPSVASTPIVLSNLADAAVLGAATLIAGALPDDAPERRTS